MTQKIKYRRDGAFITKRIIFPGGEGEIELDAYWDDFDEHKKAEKLLADKDEVIVEEEK